MRSEIRMNGESEQKLNYCGFGRRQKTPNSRPRRGSPALPPFMGVVMNGYAYGLCACGAFRYESFDSRRLKSSVVVLPPFSEQISPLFWQRSLETIQGCICEISFVRYMTFCWSTDGLFSQVAFASMFRIRNGESYTLRQLQPEQKQRLFASCNKFCARNLDVEFSGNINRAWNLGRSPATLSGVLWPTLFVVHSPFTFNSFVAWQVLHDKWLETDARLRVQSMSLLVLALPGWRSDLYHCHMSRACGWRFWWGNPEQTSGSSARRARQHSTVRVFVNVRGVMHSHWGRSYAGVHAFTRVGRCCDLAGATCFRPVIWVKLGPRCFSRAW